MVLFGDLAEGWALFADTLGVLFKKPVFLIPIFFAWACDAGIILSLRYAWDGFGNLYLDLLLIFMAIFLIAMVICMANVMMLEFMQQIEVGEKVSVARAFKEAFVDDLWKVVPVALVWTIVWFIILLIKAATSKKKRGSRPEPSPRDAAMALAGENSGPGTWLSLGLSMFEKLVRMYVFLTLPAIAWENKGPLAAFRSSLEVIKKHPLQFLTTYTLTGIASILMAVPLIIVISAYRTGTAFPDLFWTGVIMYEGIVWTFSIYMEQMSVGLLYLWHMKWANNGGSGDLSSVPKPDLLDSVYEFKDGKLLT